jgi:hypothetical protein
MTKVKMGMLISMLEAENLKRKAKIDALEYEIERQKIEMSILIKDMYCQTR